MATKRLASSAVNWAAFAERVPPNQIEAYRAMKAKSDAFISRIHRNPESLPKIDWTFYRSRIAAPGMVDAFEKAYQALNIPYPKDKGNAKGEIDKQEKKANDETQKYISEMKSEIAEEKAFLSKINSLPPLEEMTQEMYTDYFPDHARNPWNKPSLWPHTKSEQPGNDPHEIK